MGAAHKAWIAVQCDGLGQALGAEGCDDGLQRGFGREVLPRLRMHQLGRADVDGIEDLDDVLALTLGIGRDGRDILEVQLPGGHGRGPLDGRVTPLAGQGNAPMLTQDLPHGTGRAGQPQPVVA
jgi:hypothetical protein